MTMFNAPKVDRRYWAMLCFASVLGADCGDLLSRELGLGYWRGLPVLGAVFATMVFAARRAPRSPVWYWLSIVIVRAAATNLADWQALNEGEPPSLRFDGAFPVIIGAWSILLIVLALRDRRKLRAQLRSETDIWFWATMLAVGILGTAVGDWLAFMSGLGLGRATALTTVLLVPMLIALAGSARRQVLPFWVLVLVVRTWGTNVGDLSTNAGGSWLNVSAAAASTLISFLVLYRDQLQKNDTPSNAR